MTLKDQLLEAFWPVPAYVILAGIFWDEANLRGYLPMEPLEIYGLSWMTGLGVFLSVELVFTEWPNVKRRWQLAQAELAQQEIQIQEGVQ